VGQIQESIDLLNRKLNEAEMAHQVFNHFKQCCGSGSGFFEPDPDPDSVQNCLDPHTEFTQHKFNKKETKRIGKIFSK
jgi:hypothetical protein